MPKEAGLTYEIIFDQLKKAQYSPVYFLEGEETYFIDSIADYIERHALTDAEKGFNQTVVYGKDVSLAQVISAAKRFPMMAQRTVVLVREAQALQDLEKTQKSKVGGKEIEFNPLIEYLKNPLASTVLVFCYMGKKLDQRKPLGRALRECKQAIYFTADEKREYEIEPFIKRMVHDLGLHIQTDAVALLVSHVGTSLSKIYKELEKISINLKKGETISTEHIYTYVGVSKEYNIFEFQKALADRNVARLYKIATYFSEEASDGELNKNLATLLSFYYKVLLVKTKEVRTPRDAAALLNMNEFTVQDIYKCSRYLSEQKLYQIFGILREADLRTKGYHWGKSEPLEIYKELIVKLIA